MKSWQRYFEVMQEVVEDVLNTQEANIMKAAEILTDTTKNNGIPGFHTAKSVKLRNLDNTPTFGTKIGILNQYYLNL